MITENLSGYIDYFRQIAVTHKDIQHDVKSESGAAAVGSKHFSRAGLLEITGGFRTEVGFPHLALEFYEADTEAELFDNINLRPTGAFMIVCHPQDDSFREEEKCFTKAEQIIYDIIRKMYNDHHGADADCSTPFNEIDFNKISITPVGPVFGGEFGYRVVFDFEFKQTINLNEPPAEGTFIPVIK